MKTLNEFNPLCCTDFIGFWLETLKEIAFRKKGQSLSVNCKKQLAIRKLVQALLLEYKDGRFGEKFYLTNTELQKFQQIIESYPKDVSDKNNNATFFSIIEQQIHWSSGWKIWEKKLKEIEKKASSLENFKQKAVFQFVYVFLAPRLPAIEIALKEVDMKDIADILSVIVKKTVVCFKSSKPSLGRKIGSIKNTKVGYKYGS